MYRATPLVSVIIPCYNHGKYLNDAVESVLKQSYRNFEIIIVNDGSTDRTTNELLSNYVKPNTKVFNIENVGLAKARNFGIVHSQGEFILPLDADDVISTQYLEEAVDILTTRPEIKIVCCEVNFFGTVNRKMYLPEYSLETILGQNTMVCSSFYRRADYDKTHGYNPNMKYGLEDWDFWLSILEQGGEVCRINKVHFYYRVKIASMISDVAFNAEKRAYSRMQIYENHKDLFSKHFFNPLQSFEYCSIVKSREYRLGKSIMRPIRQMHKIAIKIIQYLKYN